MFLKFNYDSIDTVPKQWNCKFYPHSVLVLVDLNPLFNLKTVGLNLQETKPIKVEINLIKISLSKC